MKINEHNKYNGLRQIFGERCIFGADGNADGGGGGKGSLRKYSLDMVMDERYRAMPGAVVFPVNTEETAALMRWANDKRIPVTPRGAGSGLAGAAIPLSGGVVCSFEKMNRLIEVDQENMMVTVEPGLVTNELDRKLEPFGLFFAGYPMSESICQIGGNVAENAGGGRAIKYGVTSNYVIGAEVVTPTGTVLELGGKHLKNVTGYNLLQLLIGSEGTLGLFTKIILRVIARPRARVVILSGFTSTEQAALAVSRLRLESLPSSIEFIDGETARRTRQAIPSAAGAPIPETVRALLLVEYDADSPAGATAQKEQAGKILGEMGGNVLDTGDSPESIERVWALRKAVPWWTKQEGGQYISLEDVVVPPASVPALVSFATELGREFTLPIALFGHAGDGNFHLTPMKPRQMPVEKWWQVETALLSKLYAEVIRLGGTISGEHGIGRKRAALLGTALSPQSIESMQSIKQALDPNNVLNPGVIFNL